jgi:DNA-directed RNA polymerase specialized sigma24 family protein
MLRLALAAGGDGGDEPPGLEDLFVAHSSLVRTIARDTFHVPDDDIEDVVAEVFLRYAADEAGTAADRDHVRSSLAAITSNVCGEYRRG